jgi:hypothetical protein
MEETQLELRNKPDWETGRRAAVIRTAATGREFGAAVLPPRRLGGSEPTALVSELAQDVPTTMSSNDSIQRIIVYRRGIGCIRDGLIDGGNVD